MCGWAGVDKGLADRTRSIPKTRWLLSLAVKQPGEETLDIIEPFLNHIGSLPFGDEFGNNINQAAQEWENQYEENPDERPVRPNDVNGEHDLQNDRANCNQVSHFKKSFSEPESASQAIPSPMAKLKATAIEQCGLTLGSIIWHGFAKSIMPSLG